MARTTRKQLPVGFKEHRRADGSIRLEYRFTVDTQRISVYGYTVNECREKELAKRQELADGMERRTNPTLDQFRDTWSETRTGSTKESTLRTQYYQYVSCADVVIKTTNKRLGDMKIREITSQDIREVQNALRDPEHATFRAGNVAGKRRTAPHKPRTTNGTNDAMAHLSHVFDAARDEDIITKNPCRLVKDLRRTEKPARETIHRALSIEEQKAFFEAAKDSYYYDVFRFLLATGCRVGEAGALTPYDIRDGKIHIERTITRNGIGGYEIGASTKTGHGKRVIPMNDLIREIILHQQKLTEELTGRNGNVRDFKAPTASADIADRAIFKSPEQKILRNEAVDREIERICKRIGIPKFTAHCLRATFATRFIEQQPTEVRTLQEILGHADYGITMNLYGHVMDNTKENAMNTLTIAI